MKQFKYFLFFWIITVAISCGSKDDKKQQQQAPQKVDVNTDTVKAEASYYYDIYPATVTPLVQVEIKPQVSGNITGVYFKDGDYVRKGQKLYSIDAQQYAGAYEQAQADVDVSKANLVKAQKNSDRYLELQKNDAIANQTVDNALADLDAAKMQVAASQANARAVATNLKYTTIYSPINGTIGISAVKVGTSVYAQTLLNTVSQDEPIAADVAIDQSLIPKFADILNKGTSKTDSTFTLAFTDGSVYPYPGHIILLDRAVDQTTGTIRARITFPNSKNILRAGLTCNVRVQNVNPPNTLTIPYKAVVEQLGEYFVYKVQDTIALETKVILGNKFNGNVVVKSGLQQGEIIVTDGVQKLKDSAAINIGAPKTSLPSAATQK